MKYVVTAGGTGGHIYPALAIISEIRKQDKKSEILYIGTTDRMEKDIVPNYNIKFIGIEISGLDRKRIFKNISVLKKYTAAKKKALSILKDFNPDIVIGVGGYITLPGSKTYFDEKKVVYTGNPRSEEVLDVSVCKKSEYGFKDNLKLVVFVMGSLGSTTMTNKLKEMIESFKNKTYQVLVITGKNYYDNYKELNIPENVKLLPYCENLINLLKDTDLIVSRAGASTIAEITVIGLPAILVPSPYVTHNHQYKNALELENLGACKLITEEDFNKDKIISEIDKLSVLDTSKT